MTRIAVLGAGAGGLAAVAELGLKGVDCALWNRGEAVIAEIVSRRGFDVTGFDGLSHVKPALATLDLSAALRGADAVLVVLPTLAHADVARCLAEAGWRGPVILNPGHTGGALEFATVWSGTGNPLPPIAEFSTLTYVARKHSAWSVNVTGRAKSVRVAALPGGEVAVEIARQLFTGLDVVGDVLASSLSNVNLVLHPPGAVLCAGWIEATAGGFTFYRDGMTPGVARVMQALDDERRAVAEAFGHCLPGLAEEMARIGTVEPRGVDKPLREAISGGEANAGIKAPESFGHRYYLEDFGHGVLPFVALARVAQVPVPTAEALLQIGRLLVGDALIRNGRSAAAMGIAGLTRDQLKKRVTP